MDLRDVKLDVKIKEDQNKKFEKVDCDDTPPNMSDEENDDNQAAAAVQQQQQQ